MSQEKSVGVRSFMLVARSQAISLVPVYLPVFVLLGILAIQDAIPIQDLTGDPNATSKLPFYTGSITNLGLLLWSSAAALALFGGVFLRRSRGNADTAQFLLWSGGFTLVLVLDDMLMLHEFVLPFYFGFAEPFTFAAYLLVVLYMAARFRSVVMRTRSLPLLLACAFLSISVLVDVVPPVVPVLWHFQTFLFEDGCKLLGIVSWVTYFAQCTFDVVMASRAR